MNSSRAVFLDTASLDLGDLDLQPLHQAFGELLLHAASAPGEVAGRLHGGRGTDERLEDHHRVGADERKAARKTRRSSYDEDVEGIGWSDEDDE